MRSCIALVDKPSGITSHDVVARARKLFGTRAVGHGGTLDPFATGLLVMGVNEGTKLLRYLCDDDKTYDCVIRFGVSTDSLDVDGKVTGRSPVPTMDIARVQGLAEGWTGDTWQRAPALSAIKVNGRPLHRRVRAGEEVDPPLRRVRLHSVTVLHVGVFSMALRLHVGKGFYVRAFARDLCEALGLAGHVGVLRRVRSGMFSVETGGFSLRSVPGGAPSPVGLRMNEPMGLGTVWERVSRVVPLTREGAEHAREGRRVPSACVALPEQDWSKSMVRSHGDERSVPFGLRHGSGPMMALAQWDGDGFRVVRGIHP